MKNYGIDRKKAREATLYKIAKIQYFCLQYLSKSSGMRENYKYLYKKHFVQQQHIPTHSYALPKGKNCDAVCLITSDLILRENLPQLKRGLVKLLKKHHSHKFIGGQRSIDEILSSVENMDDTLTWHFSSVDAGRFDFDSLPNVSPFISYFDLHIRKVNDSYLSIESHIYFTEQYYEQLKKIIISDVTDNKTYINIAFKRNNRKSGGKKAFSLCHYNDSYQKSDVIFENISLIKWKYFKTIQHFFPTVLHNINVIPPSILFYKTNFNHSDPSMQPFLHSIGASWEGQAIDDNQKIFFKTNLSGRYSKDISNNLIYLYNSESISLEGGFQEIDYQIVHEFYWDYSLDIFKFQFLDIYNNYFSRVLIQYKHKLNRIKLIKNRIHSLLKLRYHFEKDIDKYSRFISDAIWEDAEKNIANLFNNTTSSTEIDYTYITEIPVSSMKRIHEQQIVLTEDFDSKQSVLQHLVNYKHDVQNRIITYIMFFIAVLTLILLIFPDWSTYIALYLTNIWTKFHDFAIKIVKLFVSQSSPFSGSPCCR